MSKPKNDAAPAETQQKVQQAAELVVPATEEAAHETATPAAEEQVEQVPMVEVAVLSDYLDHKAGTVAIIPEADLGAAVGAGWADPHPAAIAAIHANQA